MICGLAAVSAGSAFAQDQGGSGEIVVTGSRIPTQNLTSSSPLTVVSSQEAKLEGATNVETLINNLPQAFADYTEGASNGASGTATVNLRNLGNVRTLVLIDGKRLMPADPALPVADLNVIPAALVDHVEVVTGGASAVYGSDAVAGVVNFIMKKNFEGFRVDTQWGIAEHGNGNKTAQRMIAGGINGDPTATVQAPPDTVWAGRTWDVTAILGINSPDGKGNVTMYAGYRNIEAVLQSQYDYSACGSAANGSPSNSFLQCLGSSNYNRFIELNGPGGDFFPLPGRGVRARTGTDVFNFGPFNYIQRPDERYTAGAFGHYQVNEHADVYLDTMFSDDHTLAQIAPSGAFLGTGAFSGTVHVNCDNPLLGPDQVAAFCTGLAPTDDAVFLIGRRNVEGGNRIDDLRHTAYKIDLGVRGDLGNGWGYDVYGQYGATLYSENYSNELSVQRVQNALEVVDVGGVPTCKAVISGVDPNCVPLDWFNGVGNVNPDGLAYVQAQGFKTGITKETVVSGQVTGDLTGAGLKSPYAGSGVGVAFGAEYRREGLQLDTSRDFQTNDLYGQGSATLPQPYSTFQVYEIFGETRVPLIEDMPLARSLVLDLQGRWSDYSTAGGVWTYAAKLDYQPIDDFRLRASYQRAVRAPNIIELFTPQNNVLYGGQDPCSGGTPSLSQAECANTGVTAGQYGHIVECPASQCKQLIGGNTALRPEKADTYSVGVVFTPTFIRGFSATIDWFSIKVNGLIGTVAPNVSLTQCATTGLASFCDLVHRDANGFLFTDTGYVEATNTNTGYLKTDGIDFGAAYRTNLADWHMGDNGSLSIDFNGTWTDKLVTEPLPGLGTYECAGLYGVTCGTPTPKWRHRLRVTWNSPWKVTMSASWRYLSSVKLDFNSQNNGNNPLLNTGNIDLADNSIPAYSWFDLTLTYPVRDGMTLRVGANNIFDKDPPIVDTNWFGVSSPPFGNGNTFPGVYDSMGRTIFVGLTADF